MLKKRLMVGLPLAALWITIFFLPGIAGGALFSVGAGILVFAAVLEFFDMTAALGCPGYPKLTACFALAFVALAFLGGWFAPLEMGLGAHVEGLLLLVFLLVGFFRVFLRGPDREALVQHFVSVGGLIYVCWTLSFIPKLFFSSGFSLEGRMLALFVVLVTKMGDVGAFAAGTITAKRPGGNHKLVPKLSPKKSWEGLVGGIVACVLTAELFVMFGGESLRFLGVPVVGAVSAAVLGVLAAVLGLVGDLAESALKRAADVKDSGRLPGLGGALDVLDSLMLVTPVFYCYAYFRAMC